jgi:putative sterol carrier protein
VAETYDFLSEEWIDAAKTLREKHDTDGAMGAHPVKMNFIITGAPFKGEGEEINAHLDGETGTMDTGHMEDPEVTITVDYDTAKQVFVQGDQQAGMQAFMSGKIKVTGDITKLMAMQNAPADPAAEAVAAELKAMTN